MARSYRGKEVDMVSLAKQNEKTVALGNAHMNAKGDILGKGGIVIKSREELIAESKLATFKLPDGSEEGSVALWKKTKPEELDKIICPCEEHKQEIDDAGHCHCCLFFKKND